jgi:hypothetical protein
MVPMIALLALDQKVVVNVVELVKSDIRHNYTIRCTRDNVLGTEFGVPTEIEADNLSDHRGAVPVHVTLPNKATWNIETRLFVHIGINTATNRAPICSLFRENLIGTR